MRLISHSEYDVDEFSRHSLPYPFPQPMTDRCKSVCFWLYFPLFSVKVAADHAHNTWGKFPSPGPWWHSALTKSFIVTILQFVGRFIVGFGVSLSAIAECIYISEIAPAVSTVIMSSTPQSIILYFTFVSIRISTKMRPQLPSLTMFMALWACLIAFILEWDYKE